MTKTLQPLSPLHLTTPAGQAEAFDDLVRAKLAKSLPHWLDAHAVPEMGRVDVHLDEAALMDWAQAFGAVVVDHGTVWDFHLLYGGHHFELWTRHEQPAAAR